MPICTHCTTRVTHLYTVYSSAHSLRLEPCVGSRFHALAQALTYVQPACRRFADPYVEHDALTLFIDLILLKRDVYRHLLFNRGLGARKATNKAREGQAEEEAKELSSQRRRWEKNRLYQILQLGLVLVAIDTFIRWAHLHPSTADFEDGARNAAQWTPESTAAFFRIFVGCLLETFAFHFGVVLASRLVLGFIKRMRQLFVRDPRSSVPSEFSYAQIPLALLYSSLPKLFLLFLLSLWHEPEVVSVSTPGNSAPELFARAVETLDYHPLAHMLDDGVLDRAWVVRNVLGGMAAGFGLRVVLACPPAAASVVILVGWAARTAAARALGGWVGGDAERSARWLAYSIP